MNMFSRQMLTDAPMLPQNTPQAPQMASQGQNGFPWQQALGIALMQAGEATGGPQSLAPLFIQSMLRQRLFEQQAEQERMAAMDEQKGVARQQEQRQRQLADFARQNGLSPQQVAALMADPDEFMSNWSQQYRPQSYSPGERVEYPTGEVRQGNPRYYPVQPGGTLVLDPGYGGQPQNVTPQNPFEDLIPGGGGQASGGFPFP